MLLHRQVPDESSAPLGRVEPAATDRVTSHNCSHQSRVPAQNLPDGCWLCVDCGAVGSPRSVAVDRLGEPGYWSPGMTLRDYAVIHILAGIMAANPQPVGGLRATDEADALANAAGFLADAMLRERDHA